MMPARTIRMQVRRQDTPASSGYWEEYETPYRPRENVVSVLMEIAKNPRTRDGKRTSPVVYDRSCLEEVCGSCAMRVNGAARMACTALIDLLEQPIRLEPLAKFPVVRDLSVDRGSMFESLKRVKAWVPIDGTYDLGPGPRMAEAERAHAYELSKCITCGNCLEVCPQVNDRSSFMGAAPISQVALFNRHPTGKMLAAERLEALMGYGGLDECGNAQNCVRACPKSIPLTTSIAEMFRATTLHGVKGLFQT
ncbi:MAG TPA: succinate dehydrogenase iron-sulfur subunit [Thermoanaerobaculia bacterium]|nr:succinate dehydrogenase iron-sulfur subunit [Thermoanaerobaculia bacterium]